MINLLIQKNWLFNSVFWGSVLLAVPAAIAQEAVSSPNSQNLLEASVSTDLRLPDPTRESVTDSTSSNLRSEQFTTSASGLMPVELTTQISNLTDATLTDVVRASELQTSQFAALTEETSKAGESLNALLSSMPTDSEGQSTFLMPTWAANEKLRSSDSTDLELAQVRPAASGVSGPPVQSYPALTAPSTPGTPTESPVTTEEPQATTQANKWHFLFQPYVIAPLSIYGNATVRGYRADFNAGPSSIYSNFFDTFQFGVLGRLEGWTPDYRWGFLLNGDYVALRKQNSFTRPNPDRLLDIAINRIANRIQGRVDEVLRQQIADYLQGRLDDSIRQQIEANLGARLDTIIPSSFRSDVRIQTWLVDLAAAYRFYNPSLVNPEGVATEFDLGPFLIDIIGGVRIAGISGELDVTTNLGGEVDLSRSITTVKPLLGTRFRYNFSPKLAGVIAGTVAGFNIGSLGLNWQVMGGLDWMFSGNTSVGLGYRFAYIGYKSGDFDVSAYNNGPYLTFTFRF